MLLQSFTVLNKTVHFWETLQYEFDRCECMPICSRSSISLTEQYIRLAAVQFLSLYVVSLYSCMVSLIFSWCTSFLWQVAYGRLFLFVGYTIVQGLKFLKYIGRACVFRMLLICSCNTRLRYKYNTSSTWTSLYSTQA